MKVDTWCNLNQLHTFFAELEDCTFCHDHNLLTFLSCHRSVKGKLCYISHHLADLAFLKNVQLTIFEFIFCTACSKCSKEYDLLRILYFTIICPSEISFTNLVQFLHYSFSIFIPIMKTYQNYS